MLRNRNIRRAGVLALLPALAAGVAAQPVRYDGHRLVEIEIRSDADLQFAESLATPWACTPHHGWSPYSVAPAHWAALRAGGLAVRVVRADVQSLIDAEFVAPAGREDDWFTSFHDYAGITAFLDELAARRPDLVTKLTLGTSLEGRTISGLRITGAGGTSAKPALLFESCQHAREWLSPATTLFIADRLIDGYGVDATLTGLLDRAVFYIVPVVNADGYEYSWTTDRLWRKNRRDNGDGTFGVDNNRNWGHQWGLEPGSSSDGESQVYRGTAPFSEPENQNIRDFALAHPEIAAFIDFHTYSQLILSPWGYTIGEPPEPDAGTFRTLNAGMAEAISATHGERYRAGPSGETLYLASGIAPDWFYGERGALAWTIELRPRGAPGFIITPDQIIPTGEENLAAITVLAQHVAPGCPADLNGDGARDLADLGGLLANFGASGIDYDGGDLDFDGDVDLGDLGAMLALFGAPCP